MFRIFEKTRTPKPREQKKEKRIVSVYSSFFYLEFQNKNESIFITNVIKVCLFCTRHNREISKEKEKKEKKKKNVSNYKVKKKTTIEDEESKFMKSVHIYI